MSCNPTGNPWSKPQGTDMDGSPAMLGGRVQTSLRYIRTGSAVFSPKRKATVGETGAANTSTC